ncbi:MAG: U32 family peptidase [Bacilli bacterium]|nr:U32 family peptidase [Bacilli bacterium]
MSEILSPCGSKEAFYAAIEAGCDAVYLAGKMFGARSFANNFTNEELIEVINYAHLYGVRVYVTCNILIYEREVNKFLEYIEFLHKNHVDAVIMQDLGMIDLVHKTFPNLEIHGSTQMHIHNLEGALMAKKLGIKRIVLARETPIEVIKKIKEKTGLQIEVFVHGALCASYSGVCLFASSIGPRSGNRGTCSGCCRLPYDLVNKDGKILNQEKYPLSMKDLMTIHELDKLIDIGIDSFKIEGRMKGASYVYTTTKMYKETRDHYLKTKNIIVNQEDLYKLKNIFSRETTKGFILNETNHLVIGSKSPNHQGIPIGRVIKSKNNLIDIKLTDKISIHDGIRIINDSFEYGLVLNEFKINNKQVYSASKNDIISLKVNKQIPLNSQVLKTFSYEIDLETQEKINNKERKISITFSIKIKKDELITLTVSDYKNTITLTSNKPELSKNKEITKDDIREKLEKINNTIYKLENIEIDLDHNLFFPISLINNLKRDILTLLDKERIKNFEKEFKKDNYSCTVPDFKKEEKYSLLTNNKILINNKYSTIYSETLDNFIKKLPKVISSYDDYPDNQEYLIGELGGFYKLKNVISDYSLNVVNSYTVALLHSLGARRVTLSVELLDNQIKDLIDAYKDRYNKLPNLELIIKTNIELMVLKYKFSSNYKEVKYLVDRFKNKYKIIEKNDLTYIYDYKVTKKEDYEKYFSMGINYLREEIDYEGI